MRLFFLAYFGAGILAGAGASDLVRPGAGGEPTEVRVATGVLDVMAVNDTTQSFDANIFCRVRWADPRLAHDSPNAITRGLDEVWHPRLAIVNEIDASATMPRTVEVAPDGGVTYRQRVVGTFSQPLRLNAFPFDRQTFHVALVAVGYRPEEVRVVAERDASFVAVEKWAQASWTLLDWTMDEHPDAIVPQLPPPAGVTLTLEMSRNAGYFIFKLILPLVLIVAMSWFVFWIPPEQSTPRISVSVTCMLTLIAYRFMVDGLVPRVSYLTRLDLFILGATLLVFVTLALAAAAAYLGGAGRFALIKTIDGYSRWLLPVLFVALLSWSLLL